MRLLTSLLLAIVLSMVPTLGAGIPHRIEVDCDNAGALEHALIKAQRLGEVDIYLDGQCKGNFVIEAGNVTLRAATPGSGLIAPEGSFALSVLEIVDAEASVRGLVVEGGVVGVIARGRDASVLLYEVDVRGQEQVGVLADVGADLHLNGTTVSDGFIGILADNGSDINLQNVTVSDHGTGIIVTDRSFAAMTNTTVENNVVGGLSVESRSDANVIESTFRENGQVHLNANDWSSINLSSGVTVGSDSDATPYALSVVRQATITSFASPDIHGDVAALTSGTIRLGNTVVHGELSASLFANLHIRNSEVTGMVFCSDGAQAICSQTTTAGAFDCPSTSCGSVEAGAVVSAPALPELPEIEVPRLGRSNVRTGRDPAPGGGVTLEKR